MCYLQTVEHSVRALSPKLLAVGWLIGSRKSFELVFVVVRMLSMLVPFICSFKRNGFSKEPVSFLEVLFIFGAEFSTEVPMRNAPTSMDDDLESLSFSLEAL